MNWVVSAVRSWFRSVVRENSLPSPGAPVGRGQASALMPVLLASERDDDYQTLQALLHNTRWSVARALSWGEASSFCGRVVNPVVLVDRHFQGSDWRFTVASLLNPTANCCLILLSDVSDPYLWNELVQYGGFEVLARPFERSEVLRTLAFAQKHCEADWPPLHLPPENGASPAGRSK
jgi:AmiR/NasT family two-component response regulator